MHSRRARPTLRVLTEDLRADWESPYHRRLLEEGKVDELHPLSELPHPIISKAATSFQHDNDTDNYVGRIVSSTQFSLMEIKVGQWRGGVWRDEQTGVHWLAVAGLAKGNHEDRDDFYQRIKRENDDGDPKRWLPTIEDERLLKRETAARLLMEWELRVQGEMLGALEEVHEGGLVRIDVNHPLAKKGRVAEIHIEVVQVRESDYEADEIVVEILPETAFVGGNLYWQLTLRTLISLLPPEQGWDRFKDTYSNIAEPGYFTSRKDVLETLVEQGVLAQSEPGQHSHYTHKQHLAGSTIEGTAVRAMCGVFFVPTQDHDSLPCCPTCQERLSELPT